MDTSSIFHTLAPSKLRTFGKHKREKIVFKPLGHFGILCGLKGGQDEQ